MRSLRQSVLLVAVGVATVCSSCGSQRTNAHTEPVFAGRIAVLERDPVVGVHPEQATLIDEGKTTECIDPAFDNRVPAVYRTYRLLGAGPAQLDELRSKIVNDGWAPLARQGETESYLKDFGDWKSALLVVARDDKVQLILQADDKSNCS